jgi:hypothetical protein
VFDTPSNVVFNIESEKEKREKAADNMIVIAKEGHTSAVREYSLSGKSFILWLAQTSDPDSVKYVDRV